MVSEFSDYRKFIKALVSEEQTGNKRFSLIYYSRKIGASDSYLKLVVSGKRNLSLDKAYRLSKILGLSLTEMNYFLMMVLENDNKELGLKRFLRQQRSEHSKQPINYPKSAKMGLVFESSILWEIFSIIGLSDFSNDPIWIQKRLYFPTGLTQIKQSIELLRRIGAISLLEDKLIAGNLVIPHRFNQTKAYLVALERAIQFLKGGKSREATFESFCLILSGDQNEQIRKIIEEAKNKIIEVARSKNEAKTQLAYLNINFFPASK